MKLLSLKWGAVIAMLFVVSNVAAQNAADATSPKTPVVELYDGENFLGIPIGADIVEASAKLKEMGALDFEEDIEESYYWVRNAKYKGMGIPYVEVICFSDGGVISKFSADWNPLKTQVEADKKALELIAMVSKYVKLERNEEGAYEGTVTNAAGETHIVQVFAGKRYDEKGYLASLTISPQYSM